MKISYSSSIKGSTGYLYKRFFSDNSTEVKCRARGKALLKMRQIIEKFKLEL